LTEPKELRECLAHNKWESAHGNAARSTNVLCGLSKEKSIDELVNASYKLRLMGLEDEANSLDKSVRCRELREFIGRALKAHIKLGEPIPERITELIEQLVQRINENEIGQV
jgi:hypothetical protein